MLTTANVFGKAEQTPSEQANRDWTKYEAEVTD
jgi:hypothetical protein